MNWWGGIAFLYGSSVLLLRKPIGKDNQGQHLPTRAGVGGGGRVEGHLVEIVILDMKR